MTIVTPGQRRARAKTDYRAFGGAVLLGVRGIVIIGHGRSDGEAVKTAIEVARRGVENDVVGAIQSGVAEPSSEPDTHDGGEPVAVDGSA